jgi:uncharacterized membrane protein
MSARILLLVAVSLGAAGCGEKHDPINTNVCKGLTVKGMTYDEHIKPIFDDHCDQCHQERGDRHGAPPDINLDSYDHAIAVNLEDIHDVVVSSLMPPPDTNLVQQPTIEERCMIKVWIDEEAPESN